MDEVEDWEYISCSLCYASNDFRVLECGHAFCMGCLQILRKRHGRRIPCPRDRIIDRREISQLSEPHECQGEVIISSIDEERYMNLNQLIDAQIKDRMETIKVLKKFARRFKWTVRAFSLLLWYSVIYGAISLLFLIAVATENYVKDRNAQFAWYGSSVSESFILLGIAIFCRNLQILHRVIQGKHSVLTSDYFKAEQINVVLERAVVDPEFAKKWQIDSNHITGAGTVLREPNNTALIGTKGDDDEMDVLLERYILNAAANIPDDLTAMTNVSIADICRCGRNIGTDIVNLADTLEKNLKIYLVGEGHFDFVKTNDDKWAFIVVSVEKLMQFKDELTVGVSLAQLEEYGKIIEKGEGELPCNIRKKIRKEWYSHYDELANKHSQITRRRIRAANNSAVDSNNDGLATNYSFMAANEAYGTANDGCATAIDGCATANDDCVTATASCDTANASCVPVTTDAGCITANNSSGSITNALMAIGDADMTINNTDRRKHVNVIAQPGSTVQIGSGGTITHIYNYNTKCSNAPLSDDDANGTTQTA